MQTLVGNSSGLGTEARIKSFSPLEEKLIDVLKNGPLTRDEMVKKLAVPRTTVYDGLKKLIMRNEVRKNPVILNERSRGRPKVIFSLTDD